MQMVQHPSTRLSHVSVASRTASSTVSKALTIRSYLPEKLVPLAHAALLTQNAHRSVTLLTPALRPTPTRLYHSKCVPSESTDVVQLTVLSLPNLAKNRQKHLPLSQEMSACTTCEPTVAILPSLWPLTTRLASRPSSLSTMTGMSTLKVLSMLKGNLPLR